MPRYLGQHFLNNETIIDRIIASSNISKEDVVLEIGPGEGVLTEKLCQKGEKIISIELDKKLETGLKNRFKNQENLEIIFDDILKINVPQILTDRNISSYKLVANIPYYITSKIIRLFLETKIKPNEIILMIQKEVAERIVAKPGEMSILSVSVQYYSDVQKIFDVSRENFNPPPEVDSSVIKIYNLKKTDPEKDKKFFRTVKAGFCARRKTLANNLANSFHLNKRDVEEKLAVAGLPPQIRSQELSIEDWIKIQQLF